MNTEELLKEAGWVKPTATIGTIGSLLLGGYLNKDNILNMLKEDKKETNIPTQIGKAMDTVGTTLDSAGDKIDKVISDPDDHTVSNALKILAGAGIISAGIHGANKYFDRPNRKGSLYPYHPPRGQS